MTPAFLLYRAASWWSRASFHIVLRMLSGFHVEEVSEEAGGEVVVEVGAVGGNITESQGYGEEHTIVRGGALVGRGRDGEASLLRLHKV